MKVPKNEGGSNYELRPSGTHRAVICSIADIGTHTSNFNGQEKEHRKVLIGFEYLSERDSNDERFILWNRYTFSLYAGSHLRTLIEAIEERQLTDAEVDGDDDERYDMDSILGANLMMTVIHKPAKNGKTYEDIKAVVPMPKDSEKFKSSMEPKSYSVYNFDSIPEIDASDMNNYIKYKMKDSLEAKEFASTGSSEEKWIEPEKKVEDSDSVEDFLKT